MSEGQQVKNWVGFFFAAEISRCARRKDKQARFTVAMEMQ
jgi:hypothetical protein